MNIRLLNNRFTFKDLNLTIKENIFFLLMHINRRHLSPPVWKMCLIPDLPLMGENIIIFSNKTFQVLTFEKIHDTEYNLKKCLVNIWNHGKNLQDFRGQSL